MKKIICLMLTFILTHITIVPKVFAQNDKYSNIMDVYQALISEANDNDEEFESVYALYDLDNDGILELIIDNNEPHATRNILFYTFNNGLIFMGSYNPGYGELCVNPDGNGIIIHYALRNRQWLELLTYNNNVFETQNLSDPKDVYDADSYSEPHEIISGAYRLEVCSTNDNELLKKSLQNAIKTENIDLDYLTKYYWYYDCGNYTKYQFNKDGTYITFDYNGNVYDDGQRYSLENNILTFHDEWGDSSWIYVDKSYDDALSYHPEGEKVFFAPDTGYENIANTHEEVPVEKEIKVVLNGKEIEFDQPPINTPEGRLLVPIRKIAESMDKIVLYSEETKTAFIDNSTTALIVPMFEKTMYLANENGFNYWENVALDVPAIESNGRILVPVRAFCESLGATVIWEDEIKTAFITYDDSMVSERMNDMLFDSINLVWYIERLDALWATETFPFDEHTVVIDDFYINRPYWADAVTMGLSDPFAGIQDLISMTNGSDNATNIILKSMQEILSEVPSGTDLNFDAGIVKILKEMVASGVDIYSEVDGLGYKIRSYSDAFVFLDDALLDYSKNYHSTVSGIFDLSVFTLEELAYLLTEYQTNVEYLNIFENKLKEAGYSDETIEKSVSLLRTQYTNKFIGVMLDLRSACVESSVGAVLNAGLTIAGHSTWGVGVGMLGWKVVFGVFGVNKKGDSLKTFYGLYCIDNGLNSTFNDIVSTHETLTSSELLELRRLIELLKAEKITAYKAMKNITNWYNEDSKVYADEQIEKIKKFSYRIFK